MNKMLNRLTWDTIGKMDRDNTYFVLPISSMEQHGKHLPVGTDDIILERVLENICEGKSVFESIYFLPTIHYGNSCEHCGFPGTISLRADTVVAMIEDVLSGMKQHAFKNLIILNSHGGNSDLLRAFAQEWKLAYSINVYTINIWASGFFNDAAGMIKTPLEYEIHAGEIETSILMHTDGDCVKREMILRGLDVYATLNDYDCGWTSKELSPGNGIIGAASKADAETGEKILEYMRRKILFYFSQIIQGNRPDKWQTL